ncbi:DUF1697 domain-containing protein [Streptomyces aidingensis]|uniref:Uncharacterized conserved protein, DUF1697 family n=1 Tax=Streptomyces aidingensis TaxID=910347 RepID=A0A1I1INA7_9ACTN|nr:DUF1697 domain-containing protein [Streptomyces aidingensis]SFC37789.1 Uncharacterized conserved protein, DUF1697 family [Streptomyces aidingensis]
MTSRESEGGGGRVAHVALLRGINVGGSRKVPMAALREVLAGLGHGAVRTYVQSGNAVFTAPPAEPGGLARALERAVRQRFGFAVDALVLPGAELRAVAARCPFPAAGLDPARLAVLLLDVPAAGLPLAAADPASFAPDEFRIGEREVFAWFPGGMGRSKLGEVLSRPPAGAVGTVRNWRTVTRLLEMAAELEGTGPPG